MASFNPPIDIIIPTLNSAKVLSLCLSSIRSQHYPQSKINIFVIDGGSTDKTISIAKKYNCQIYKNPYLTGEAGKAIGIKKSKAPFIALIDSDNILPSRNWLTKMLYPLQQKDIIGSEPIKYTYRPTAGFIERYSALTGANDPYTLVAGNFDRQNYLYNNWTNLAVKYSDHKSYILATLDPKAIMPTIGANGTIFKKELFSKFSSNYLFDIDVLTQQKRPFLFAKVKVGIIHTFCESSINKFVKKQFRRATDLYSYQQYRTYPLTQNNLIPTLKFILYVILFFPMTYHMLKGFVKKPDVAWFFHPLACIITLYVYGLVTTRKALGLLKPVDRLSWQQ